MTRLDAVPSEAWVEARSRHLGMGFSQLLATAGEVHRHELSGGILRLCVSDLGRFTNLELALYLLVGLRGASNIIHESALKFRGATSRRTSAEVFLSNYVALVDVALHLGDGLLGAHVLVTILPPLRTYFDRVMKLEAFGQCVLCSALGLLLQ